MGMLKAVIQNARTVSASMEFCWRTYLIPCFRLLKIDSLDFCGRNRVEIIESEMIGARKETALSPKHHFSPSFARAWPASAGPMVTAILNWIEFNAMAFGISSRSTKVGMSAWYAGPPNAWANPDT